MIEMENIRIFENAEFGRVRTTIVNDEPYFVGKDVCDVLGYNNSRDALSRHIPNKLKADVVIHDGRQNRNMTVINESGLYRLIFSSKLSNAERFTDWVTSEVLPTIRKNWWICK